jgi:hypothetical protein
MAPLMKILYQYPIITSRGVQKNLGIALDTAIDWLQKFESLKILREITGQRRSRIYRFDRYIDILDAGWTGRKMQTQRIDEATKGLDDVAAGRVKDARRTIQSIKRRRSA